MAYKQNNPFSRRTSSPFNQNGDNDRRSGYKKKEGYIYQPEIKGEEVRGKAVPFDTDNDGIPDVMRTTGTTNYSITGNLEDRGGPKAPDHEWAAFLKTPEGQEWVKNQTDMQERKVIKHYDEPFIPEEEEQEETPNPHSVYIGQRRSNIGTGSFGRGHTDERKIFEGPDAEERALKWSQGGSIDGVVGGGFNERNDQIQNAIVYGTNRNPDGELGVDYETIYEKPNRISKKEDVNRRRKKLIEDNPRMYGPNGRIPMELASEDIIHENSEMPKLLTGEEIGQRRKFLKKVLPSLQRNLGYIR